MNPTFSLKDLALLGGALPSGISPEAQTALDDWVTRVQGVGSNVTIAGTQTAVGIFIDGLMTDGVWSKIVRMSIYAGDGLLALGAPLKNGGPSATDVVNMFVSGDYSQSVGLTGTVATSKYINTGLDFASGLMGDNDIHISIYTRTAPESGKVTFQNGVGSTFGGLTINLAPAASGFYPNSGFTAPILNPDPTAIGHYIGSRTAVDFSFFMKNGSVAQSVTNAGGNRIGGAGLFHTQFYNGAPNSAGTTGATFELYSMGLGLTETDAVNFTNRYSTLRTALGR